jgi:hypothetical protein
VTISSDQQGPGAVELAERLRDLRKRAPITLTQSALGQALGDAENPVGPAALWENPSSGRVVPIVRPEVYTLLFCTPRSFEGSPRLFEDAELKVDECKSFLELKEELAGLRDVAIGRLGAASGCARSMWHSPDGSRITLACSRQPPDRWSPSSDPERLNYVRLSDLADCGALVDIYGAIRAYNPTSRVVIGAAQDLT